MTDRDRERLVEIVELIDLIDAQLEGVSEVAFVADRLLVDGTAFRLLHVGENALRLSGALQARHPHIPWRAIVGMRNYIAHDYGGASLTMVWATVMNDLAPLRAVCVTEMASNNK